MSSTEEKHETEVSRRDINDDVRAKITTAFQEAREQGPTVAGAKKKSRAIIYTEKSLMESAQPILDTFSSSQSTHRHRDILSHDIGEAPVVKDLDSLFQECLVALGFPEPTKDDRLQMSPKQKQSFWSFKEKK
jgi:hypothetical protein